MNAVIVGAPMEEQTVYGPFADFEEAAAWCEQNGKKYLFTWIMRVHPPEELE
jgi:hypothetical protein